LLETVTVGPDEFENAAAEFGWSVQIVSRLPDQNLNLKLQPKRSLMRQRRCHL
jgi:hypothetical protein